MYLMEKNVMIANIDGMLKMIESVETNKGIKDNNSKESHFITNITSMLIDWEEKGNCTDSYNKALFESFVKICKNYLLSIL